MDFLFLPGQSYDCVRCAKGCRSEWRMHVDPYSEKQIRGSGLELRVIQEHGQPGLVEDEDGALITAKRQGRCVFLQPDDLCGIHAEMGIDAKPIGCRQFPFLIRPTPDGVVVGVSFFCTAVQQNTGRPLEEHADEVRAILEGIKFSPVGEAPMPVVFDCTLDWAAYKVLEGAILDWLDRDGLEAAAGRALSAVARVSGPGVAIAASDLEKACATAEVANHDPTVHQQTRFFQMALSGFLESPQPEHTQVLTQAMLSGEEVDLPRFGWRGAFREIEQLARDADHLDGQIDRYGRALVQRKFLVQGRDLYANLALLHLLPGLLRLYSALAALARGATVPEEPDYFRALDVAEVDLVTHAKGLDPLYAAVAEGYLRLLSG